MSTLGISMGMVGMISSVKKKADLMTIISPLLKSFLPIVMVDLVPVTELPCPKTSILKET